MTDEQTARPITSAPEDFAWSPARAKGAGVAQGDPAAAQLA
jgi:hypothetical protein